MTERPIRKTLEVYQGSDFSFAFRVTVDGDYITPEDVIFRTMEHPGGEVDNEYSLNDSPSFITIDEDKIITIALPAVTTLEIENELYFEIDTVYDGETKRRFIGTMLLYKSKSDGA